MKRCIGSSTSRASEGTERMDKVKGPSERTKRKEQVHSAGKFILMAISVRREIMITQSSMRQRVMTAGVLMAGLTLAGCASTPAPTAEIAVSKNAMASATSAGAA